MKKTLLMLLLASATCASAQQKLTGRSLYYYDNSGAIQYIDSSSYQYPTWEGSLNSSEPAFSFDNPIFDWTFQLPLIHCGTESTFSGSSLPLSPFEVIDYTITGGNVTRTESAFDRTDYTYDANGNTTSIAKYIFNSPNWVQVEEETFEYDANQNVLVRNIYEFPSGTAVNSGVDSMTYNASNQLTEAISYGYDQGAGQWFAYSKSIIAYSGTEVSTLQLFEGDMTTPLEQAYTVEYTYTAGKPTQLEGFEVVGGVPQTPAQIVYDYSYGANQKISTIEGAFGGNVMEKREFTYDAQGFLTNIASYEFDFGTSMLFVYEDENYYYTSTVGVDENTQANLSVFPNPVNDVLTISSDENVEYVSVFSSNGKIMIEQNANSVDVSELPAGTYIVNVKTAKGVTQTRFVKN